jgi:hypothetical protein
MPIGKLLRGGNAFKMDTPCKHTLPDPRAAIVKGIKPFAGRALLFCWSSFGDENSPRNEGCFHLYPTLCTRSPAPRHPAWRRHPNRRTPARGGGCRVHDSRSVEDFICRKDPAGVRRFLQNVPKVSIDRDCFSPILRDGVCF